MSGIILAFENPFIELANALHVLNAPNPGANASLAIGGHIAAKVSRLIASN